MAITVMSHLVCDNPKCGRELEVPSGYDISDLGGWVWCLVYETYDVFDRSGDNIGDEIGSALLCPKCSKKLPVTPYEEQEATDDDASG